jgi:hypothetical protein
MLSRGRRETLTYRGASGAYYGFTVFSLEEALPRAAGIFALATQVVGAEGWNVLLIGETANFAAQLSANDCGAIDEARRRGASHALLYVSPIATERRREAAQDLWRHIRSPLVGWDSANTERRA